MRGTQALRMFRPTARMMRPIPKEDQAGHTISQRLRKLKQIPAELFPLGNYISNDDLRVLYSNCLLAVVVGFAVFAAGYSCLRKFTVDKNLRLGRQGASGRAEH
ncbi:hypothetical protein E4U21_004822 [Claviceps maximensis]|nr:hypothetical protein E4U21_004822 [Claviceps maximensis]